MRPPTSPAAGPAIGAPGLPGGNEPDVFLGQELCGYTITRKLAEGGMGVVYEGHHHKIGRTAAIKVLKLEFCRSEDVVERFYQEARAVNSIRHENIVDIYDFGRDPYGRVFFVMEYLEGEPLSLRIRRGALSWGEAFPILDQTLRALKAAHDKGFVHRDLKPDNIWLKYVEGRVQVKLLDFGIAKLVGTESPAEKLTKTGSVIGTPHYMSPEQINGARDIDHRTDIYALGVITYEMFAGVTPFVGDTLQAIMTGHLFKEPPRLAAIPANLGVPAPVAEIVDRMLFKDASGRYDSVTQVLSDLHDVNRNQWPVNAATLNKTRPTRAPGPHPLPGLQAPAERPTGGKRGLVIGGTIAVVLAAAAGVAVWQSRARSAAPPIVATSDPATKTAAMSPTPPQPEPPKAPPPLDPGKLRDDARATLRASLRETEPVVRWQGSDALGKIQDQPSVPPLTALTENDPDAQVRGHAAEALGILRAAAAVQLLGKLEKAAPAPLKVWYASALARLGDKGATSRLIGYARSKDLAVSFKAGMTLADLSAPGDKKAIAALKSLIAQEAKLREVMPYAGAVLLTKLATLRAPKARELLYSYLKDPDEGTRLAAAEGLAQLGDDAGKEVLQGVFANPSSPNQLVAAVVLISLGEYGGLDLITAQLTAGKSGDRQLAARALGDIGDARSLPALVELASSPDWTVRIAAAAAIVTIVGLDQNVLAQASIAWTEGALGSTDWAVRRAAAGVLADIADEQKAVPLLAQAMLDSDRNVRLAASRSAGKMKSAEAVAKVVAAVEAEADPQVQEQQVTALGEIGRPEARATLARMTEKPGRIGVLAAGSLIAVGDPAGNAKLEAAVAAPATELRLAAVQAASMANNAIVVPTLKIGVGDKVFEVRFLAAEGLAALNAEKAAAVPVLTAALDSKDAGFAGRALAALTRLGEPVGDKARTAGEMLDSADPKVRLAAVPVVRAMPSNEAVPLLRRLIADRDQEVRRAGVDAIESLVSKNEDQAIKLYKPLVNDEDPVVRSKAAGQLARLVQEPPPVQTADTTKPGPTPAVVDDTLPQVTTELEATRQAAKEAAAAIEAVEAKAKEVTATVATATEGNEVPRVTELRANLDDAADGLEAIAAKVEGAAAAASKAAGATPSDEARKLIAETTQLAKQARSDAAAAVATAARAKDKADRYIAVESDDVPGLLAAADSAIRAGDFAEAKNKLDQASTLLRKAGTKNSRLDDLYGQYYDGRAGRTKDPAAKVKLLQQAQDAYLRFAKSGSGRNLQRVTLRLAEIDEDLKDAQP